MAERTSPDPFGAGVRFAKVEHSDNFSPAKRNAPACPENPRAWTDPKAGGRLKDQRPALNCRG